MYEIKKIYQYYDHNRMNLTQKLIDSGFFKKGSLKKGEALFEEGRENTCIYIILEGTCSVRKIIGNQQKKEISIIAPGDILGEGALSGKYEKNIDIFAITDVEFIYINVKDDFQNFSKSAPLLQQKFLISIIDVTNKRLLEINSELISNYHVSQAISNISDISYTSIKKLLLLFSDILHSNKIVYLEKNPIVDEFYKIIFHNTLKSSLKNSIIKIPGGIIDNSLKKLLDLNDEYIFSEILLGGEKEGIIVVSREDGIYDDKSHRILGNISTSFAGIMNQKKIQDEQRNISYLKRK